jgi:RNA polymerase II subunit A small phosphatase-like protein
MTKPLLILDLDETLIHASEWPLALAEDFRIEGFWVYVRPGLREFLTSCSAFYRIAVWSSASDDYVEEIVNQAVAPVVPLEFVWGRSRGTYRRDFDLDEYFHAKDLYKVKRRGYDLSQVLIVDDEPRKIAKNYGNAIYIDEFEGDEDDRELTKLSAYLEKLSSAPEFRTIEKRRWNREA